MLTVQYRGVKALVRMVNIETGEGRIIISSPFDYYRFQDVPSGATYFVEVRDKRNQFTPQIVTVNGDTILNFVGSQ